MLTVRKFNTILFVWKKSVISYNSAPENSTVFDIKTCQKFHTHFTNSREWKQSTLSVYPSSILCSHENKRKKNMEYTYTRL